MQIPFLSIKKEKRDISFDFVKEGDQVNVKGFIKRLDSSFVELNITLKGVIEVECISCLSKFSHNIDEKVKLRVSNRVVKNSEFDSLNDSYDIIEVLKGNLDISEIIKGEINLLKSDYYKCNKCIKE